MNIRRIAAFFLPLVLVSSLANASSKYGPTSGGGGGAVSSVSPGSGCATISPTTGAVIVTTTGCLAAANNLSDLASPSTARTNLGLGTLATQNGTFSGTSSGTNSGDQTITLTGDATGSGTGSFAVTIANSVVTLAKQANLAANSFQGNNTGSPTAPLALTVAQAYALLGVLPAANFPALTGDVTTTAGSLTTQLAATVGGIAGGRTLTGGNASGNGWSFSTTSNATKGTFTISDGQLVVPAGTATSPGIQVGSLATYGLLQTGGYLELIAGVSGATILLHNNGRVIASNGWWCDFTETTVTKAVGSVVTMAGDTGFAVGIGSASTTSLITSLSSLTTATATSAVLNAVKFPSVTQTFTGTTHVTTASGVNWVDFEAPTYTDASAATIDVGATFTVKGAPIAAGSLTITNPYALWVQAGTSLFGGPVALSNTLATPGSGVIVTTDAPTAVVSLSLKYINLQLNGVTTYVLALQ